MKSIISLIFFALAFTAVKAQKLTATIKGVSDTVYLANYFGGKLYYADTAVAKKGVLHFDISNEKQGKYAVVVPGPKFFEVVIADGEDIILETDTANLAGHMVVKKSANNKIMYDYVNFINGKKAEREALATQLAANEGNAEKTAAIKSQYNQLNDEVRAYQEKIISEHPELFVAKEIKMSMDVTPPKELQDNRAAAYYYFRKHYFDNIDFSDDRLVRTAVFANKVENFFTETVLQNADTLIAVIDTVMKKIEPGTEMYQYVVHFLTYHFETSNIMGMDKVFVHVVNNYLTDERAFWIEEDQLQKIQDRAAAKKYTLVGLQAPELILTDSAGNWKSSYKDVPNKYTLLFFFDPDCGHCKKETPKLVDFVAQNDSIDLGVYTISADNSDHWTKFLKTYKMGDFVNVTIPQRAFESPEYATSLVTSGTTNIQSLKFQDTFDVYSTPKLFLLDKDHVIRAKDFGVENLPEIIKMVQSYEKFRAAEDGKAAPADK